jgi:hypothetical protein
MDLRGAYLGNVFAEARVGGNGLLEFGFRITIGNNDPVAFTGQLLHRGASSDRS